MGMSAFLSTADQSAPEPVRFAVGDTFVAAHVYLPAGHRPGDRHPAVAVAGSLTSVKEQMGGIHAAELANRGVLAMAIDYRHFGESGGEPRQYDDAAIKSEDLVAAVAYLATRPDVDADGVGLLGVCTSGGNVLYAAAGDGNVVAVATVAGHFAEPDVIASVPVYGGPGTIERHRSEGRAARAAYERIGENRLVTCYHDSDPEAAFIGPMEYYLDERRGGGVRQWRNAFAVMSWEPWLDFDPVREAARVRAPTLIVHSDRCIMPGQARRVHDALAGPKAMHWTTGDHFDFYDSPEKVREAADAVADHFHRHLS